MFHGRCEMNNIHDHNCILRWLTPVRRVLFARVLICVLFAVYFCSFAAHAERVYEPVDAVIPFECVNDTGVENVSFNIKLKAEDSGAPVPEDSLITLDKAGKGEFRITILEPGNYVYRVYQEKGNNSDVKYDDRKYDVHVCVLNGENDKLIYTVAVNYADTDVKPTALAFENEVASDRKTPSTEETTEDTNEHPEKKQAQTGDDSGIWFELFFISLIGVLVLLGIKYISGKGGQHE